MNTGRIRTPYTLGLGAHGKMKRLLAYGRAFGLTIEDHHDGGWFIRTGWLVVSGPSDDLHRFHRAMIQISDD